MLNKRATYGDDWGVPSAEHPAGPCLNRSAPGVEDGSYFEKSWVNDLMALPGAIMNAAGYTPNGTEDTATASQVFDALVNGRWSEIANYSVGTIVTASNGKQYYCNKESGRDSEPKDPATDTLDNWRQYPHKITKTSAYMVVEHFDGLVEMSFSGRPSNSEGISECPFPANIILEDSNYRPIITDASNFPNPEVVAICGLILSSRTPTGFNSICVNSDGVALAGESPQIYLAYRKA